MSEKKYPEWPSYSEAEIHSVSSVLSSGKVNYWTGSVTRQFEKEFAKWCGAKHAVAVSNGTVALDLCLMSLGIGARNGGGTDDEVIVTPRSFVASGSVIVNAGAIPKFVDVCPDSQNMNPAKIKDTITDNTKAVICVHLAGWPCDIDAIKHVIGSRDIKIIEDCAQAHGALYKGQPVGSLGDVAAWSFCQDKIMTTGGEGGMVTCNDHRLWNSIWSYKDHGKSYDRVHSSDQPKGFRWVHDQFGSNYRLTEMQSAIGRLQLQKMPSWTAARAKNSQILIDAFLPFAGIDGPIRIPTPKCEGCNINCPAAGAVAGGCRHAYYRFYVFIRAENMEPAWSRDRIIDEMLGRSVPCMQGSCSQIYNEQSFQSAGLQPAYALPIAQKLGDSSVAFLVHPTLDEEHMKSITAAAVSVFKRATK